MPALTEELDALNQQAPVTAPPTLSAATVKAGDLASRGISSYTTPAAPAEPEVPYDDSGAAVASPSPRSTVPYDPMGTPVETVGRSNQSAVQPSDQWEATGSEASPISDLRTPISAPSFSPSRPRLPTERPAAYDFRMDQERSDFEADQDAQQRAANSARTSRNASVKKDLRARGIPGLEDYAGDTQPARDPATGAPLTQHDRAHNVAYAADGSPVELRTNPDTGAVEMRPAMASARAVTDPKTGDTYQVRAGLPWQWTGVDAHVSGQIADEHKRKLDAEAAAALSGPIAEARAAYGEHKAAAHAGAKELQARFGELGLPVDPDFQKADPQTLRERVESATNEEFAAPAANASPWFGGGRYSPEADRLREDIQRRKEAALGAVGEHAARLDALKESQGALVGLLQQQGGLRAGRLADVNARRVAAGLAPVGGQSDNQTMRQGEGETRSPNSDPTLQDSNTPISAPGEPAPAPGDSSGARGLAPASPREDGGASGGEQQLIQRTKNEEPGTSPSLFARAKNFLASLTSGAASGVGEALTGAAQFANAQAHKTTTLEGVADLAPNLSTLGLPALMLRGLQSVGIDPIRPVSIAGQALKGVEGVITDPQWHDNGEAKAGRFIGGVGAFIAQGAIAPETLLPTLFAQGYAGQFESAQVHAEAAGVPFDEATADKAGLLGGAINMVLGIPLEGAGKTVAAMFGKAAPDAVSAAFSKAYEAGGAQGVANLLTAWRYAVEAMGTPAAQAGFREAAAKSLSGVIAEISKTAAQRAAGVATRAARDATLFGGTQAAQNVVAQSTYEPERPLMAGVAESALGGLAVGGLFGGIDAVRAARAAGRAKATLAEKLGPKSAEKPVTGEEVISHQSGGSNPSSEPPPIPGASPAAPAAPGNAGNPARRPSEPPPIPGLEPDLPSSPPSVVEPGTAGAARGATESASAPAEGREKDEGKRMKDEENGASPAAEEELAQRKQELAALGGKGPPFQRDLLRGRIRELEAVIKQQQAQSKATPPTPSSSSFILHPSSLENVASESGASSGGNPPPLAVAAWPPEGDFDEHYKPGRGPAYEKALGEVQGFLHLRKGAAAYVLDDPDPRTALGIVLASHGRDEGDSEGHREAFREAMTQAEEFVRATQQKHGLETENKEQSTKNQEPSPVIPGLEPEPARAQENQEPSTRNEEPSPLDTPSETNQNVSHVQRSNTPEPGQARDSESAGRAVIPGLENEAAQHVAPGGGGKRGRRAGGSGRGGVVQSRPAAHAAGEVEDNQTRGQGEGETARDGRAPAALDNPTTVDAVAHSAITATQDPSDAQKEAGNYRMGHARIGGLDISIENPAGTSRRPEWPPLASHYGYIKGSMGKDGDHIDIFIKPGTPHDYVGPVFVVNQTKADGTTFDEHKAVIGPATEEEARTLYLANYSKGWKGGGDIARFPDVAAFKEWATGAARRTAPARSSEDKETIRQGEGETAAEGRAPARSQTSGAAAPISDLPSPNSASPSHALRALAKARQSLRADLARTHTALVRDDKMDGYLVTRTGKPGELPTIAYNPAAMAREMAIVQGNGQDPVRAMHLALHQEAVHARQLVRWGRQFKPHYTRVWGSLGQAERAAFLQSYTDPAILNRAGKPVAYLAGAEYERMVIQQREHGITSEDASYRQPRPVTALIKAPQGRIMEESVEGVETLSVAGKDEGRRMKDEEASVGASVRPAHIPGLEPEPAPPKENQAPRTKTRAEREVSRQRAPAETGVRAAASNNRYQEPPPSRRFAVRHATDTFTDEPVIHAIIDQGGLMSKSTARAKWSAEKWRENQGEWDDVPRLSHPTHNTIYKPGGLQPDEMAKALVDASLLPEGATVADLWAAIGKASVGAASLRRQMSVHAREGAQREKQERQFTRDAAKPGPGEKAIPVESLQIGDQVTMGGEKLKVVGIDPDTFDVTLEDHEKYGIQEVRDGVMIYGRLAKAAKGETSAQSSVPSAQTPKPAAPVLDLERQTEESIAAQRTADATSAKKKAQDEEIDRRKAAPLTGSSENVGQGALFSSDADLFSGPSAERNAGNPARRSGELFAGKTRREGNSGAMPEDNRAADQSGQPSPSGREAEDYRGEHTAPDRESGSPLHDVTANGIYPEDVYSHEGLRYYGTGEDALDRTAWNLIQSLRGKPNAKVPVYRAVPYEATNAERIERYEEQKRAIQRRGKIPEDADIGNWKNSSAYYEHANAEIERLKSASEPVQTDYQFNQGDWITPIRKYAVDHGKSALNGKFKIIKKVALAKDLFTNGDSWLEWGYDPEKPSPENRASNGDALELHAGKTNPEPSKENQEPRTKNEEPTFFSQLTRTVQGLPQATMTVAQARAAITKGAKADEIKASGILDDPLSPLAGKSETDKVTRYELADYAIERQTRVEDVVLGDVQSKPFAPPAFTLRETEHQWEAVASDGKKIGEVGKGVVRNEAEARQYLDTYTTNRARDRYIANYNKEHEESGTKFSKYQLPGADEGSYREMFVTWPGSEASKISVTPGKLRDGSDGWFINQSEGNRSGYRSESEARRIASAWNEQDAAKLRWQDGHSQYADITNPVVRIRRNIRTDSDGQKTYFIEEMQGPSKDNQAKMPEAVRKRIYEIGMKRAIRDAIDEGADAIGWTTGEQQAERYDLSKHVDAIDYAKLHDGKVAIYGVKNGSQTQIGDKIDPSKLEEYVGKEVAKKIMDGHGEESSPSGYKRLTGENLKIGGEGLRNLYDKMLPRILEKLAEKVGGKVGEAKIVSAVPEDASDPFDAGREAHQMEAENLGIESKPKMGRVAIHSMPLPEAWTDAAPSFALYAGRTNPEPAPEPENQAPRTKNEEPSAAPHPSQSQLRKDDGTFGEKPDTLLNHSTADAETKAETGGLTPGEALLVGHIIPRTIHRLYRGAADTLKSVGSLHSLGVQVDKWIDKERELNGKMTKPFRAWQEKWNRGEQRKAQEEFLKFAGEYDRGDRGSAIGASGRDVAQRFYDTGMSPAGRELLDAWQAMADRMGTFSQAIGMQTRDADGSWRPMRKVSGRYFPRALKPEYLNAIYDPAGNPKAWREVLKIMIEAGMGKNEAEVLTQFRKAGFSPESRQDFFSSLERARVLKLPNKLYDYSFEAAVRYMRAWVGRSAQVYAFGQKTTSESRDAFGQAIDATYDRGTKEYLQAVSDRVYGVTPRTMGYRALGILNSIATGTQLTNPITQIANFLGGTIDTAHVFGVKHTLKGLMQLGHLADTIRDAHDRGILHEDLREMVHDADQLGSNLGTKISRWTAHALKFTGYNLVESINRGIALLSARSMLQQAIKTMVSAPESRATREYEAFLRKSTVNPAKIIAENGEGPETDRFFRYTINEAQGGYRPDQLPPWINAPVGKFLFKYQPWGVQQTRMFVRRAVEPANEFVRSKGKSGTMVPLLRYFLLTAAAGLVLEQIKAMVFGTPQRTASLEEIQRTATEDQRRAWILGAQKLWTGMMLSGAGGLIANYGQSLTDVFERSRFKNPLTPPGLASVTNAGELLFRAIEQHRLTPKDFDDFLNAQLSLYRTTKAAAARVAPTALPMETARQNNAWLNVRTHRFADEVGLEATRTSMGRIGKTVTSPEKRDLLDALRAGDLAGAKTAMGKLTAGQPLAEKQATLESLRATVRASMPVRVGAAGDARRELFLAWATRRLPVQDIARIRAIDKTYRDTAERAGLYHPAPVSDRSLQKAAGKLGVKAERPMYVFQ